MITTEMTAAERTIRERIRRQGSITFAEFMRTALYHPADGYYTSEKPFGASGDYYTSPAAHPAFGALLAAQLLGMWRTMGEPADFTVVEMGAGNGLLAADICAAVSGMAPEFARSLRYLCVDRYAPIGGVIGGALGNDVGGFAAHPSLGWVRADALPLCGVVGCFISNELVDAFPVHRFRMADGEAHEILVGLDDDGGFVELTGSPTTPLIAQRLAALDFALADGQCGEVNPQIADWMRQIADALYSGFVITIDYGYEAAELYAPKRRHGTLQTYYRHTDGSSPYQRTGRQDISAHVDFSLLQSEGHAAGLNTLAYTTQAEYLNALGMGVLMRRLRNMPISRYERSANLMAMRELVKPDGLGGFKALIQEKNTGITSAAQTLPHQSLCESMDAPLLSRRHMPLMEGRYPHTTWETPSLWDESQLEPR